MGRQIRVLVANRPKPGARPLSRFGACAGLAIPRQSFARWRQSGARSERPPAAASRLWVVLEFWFSHWLPPAGDNR